MSFWNIITKNWVESVFDKISLALYEKEQEIDQKKILSEKSKIVRHNRIIVKVNNDVIYDSKKSGVMSDDLYFALLSYGLMESIKNKTNKNSPISYNISPTISSLPVLQNKAL